MGTFLKRQPQAVLEISLGLAQKLRLEVTTVHSDCNITEKPNLSCALHVEHSSETQTAIPICNNTSVGMIVERGGQYLLFRRVKKPWGYALSAGHVDELPSLGHPNEVSIYEQAARRELFEEVG